MLINPVTLKGARVCLEPLTLDHLDALSQFALSEEIWRYFPIRLLTREDLKGQLQSVLDGQTNGTDLCFVVIERASGNLVGTTRFMNIEVRNRGVEIGGTMIDPQWQRTFVNTETKYLMLRHAFETWRCIRVCLKTDSLNLRSRAAILRLGARDEGTLRNHIVMPDGRFRHSVYFSIIESEWPAVKANLEVRLSAKGDISLRSE